MSRQKTTRSWKARDYFGLGLGILVISMILLGVGAFFYYLGVPEHVDESRFGSRPVAEQPAQLPKFRAVMIIGEIGLALSIVVMTGARIAMAMGSRTKSGDFGPSSLTLGGKSKSENPDEDETD